MVFPKNTNAPEILLEIGSSVETPICTYQITNKPPFHKYFGHFDRVLVDIVLRKEPFYRVLIEINCLYILTYIMKACLIVATFAIPLVTLKEIVS